MKIDAPFQVVFRAMFLIAISMTCCTAQAQITSLSDSCCWSLNDYFGSYGGCNTDGGAEIAFTNLAPIAISGSFVNTQYTTYELRAVCQTWNSTLIYDGESYPVEAQSSLTFTFTISQDCSYIVIPAVEGTNWGGALSQLVLPPWLSANGGTISAGTYSYSTIASGDDDALNFFLILTPLSSISGYVECTCDGSPISGATVHIGNYSATTTNNGSYSISNLATGTYAATISAPNYYTTNVNITIPSGPSSVTNNFTLIPSGAMSWDPSAFDTSPGSGGSGTWDNSTPNWWLGGTEDVSWCADEEAEFSGTAGTVTLGSNISANRLTFTKQGYVITGENALTLEDPGAITVPVDGSATIACTLEGVGYTVSGGGTLNLVNAGNFSGGSGGAEAVIGNGTTLEVVNENAVGSGISALSLNNGTYQNDDTVANDQFLPADCAVSLQSGGGVFINPNADLTMTCKITGQGALDYIGGEDTILTLANANDDYSGGTIIDGPGELFASQTGVLGNKGSSLIVESGVLDLGGNSHTIGVLTTYGGTIQNGSATTPSITKSSTDEVELSNLKIITGQVSISAGTLTLSDNSSIVDAGNFLLSYTAILDVSDIGPYVLSAGFFTAQGFGAEPGINAATIYGSENEPINFGSVPITLDFAPASDEGDLLHPSLYIQQGMLILNANQFTIVNVTPNELGPGVYRIIQQAQGNVGFSGLFPDPIVRGPVVEGATASIEVVGANVNLVIFVPPNLEKVRTQNNSLMFDLPAEVEGDYQIQSSTGVSPPEWVNVGSPIPATGNPITISLPIVNVREQMFRVSFVP